MTASEGARNDNLLLSLRGIPPPVIARSGSDEAISKRDSSLSLGTRIATLEPALSGEILRSLCSLRMTKKNWGQNDSKRRGSQ